MSLRVRLDQFTRRRAVETLQNTWLTANRPVHLVTHDLRGASLSGQIAICVMSARPGRHQIRRPIPSTSARARVELTYF